MGRWYRTAGGWRGQAARNVLEFDVSMGDMEVLRMHPGCSLTTSTFSVCVLYFHLKMYIRRRVDLK